MVLPSYRANNILWLLIRIWLGITFVRVLIRFGMTGQPALPDWLLAVVVYTAMTLVGYWLLQAAEPYIDAVMTLFARMLVLGLLASGLWLKFSLFATRVTAGILAAFCNLQQIGLVWLLPLARISQQSQRRHPLTDSYSPRHGAYILYPLTQSLLFFG